MSEYFPEATSLGGRVKVELDLTNYATKSDLKMQQVLKYVKKVDLTNLKPNVDKLDVDKLKNVSTNWSIFLSVENTDFSPWYNTH